MDRKFPLELKELNDLMQVTLKPDEVKEKMAYHGNIEGIARKLNVNLSTGLITSNKADLELRKKQFGVNEIPPKPAKKFITLMWEAVQDTTLIILITCAFISIVLWAIFHDDSNKLSEEYTQTRKYYEPNT